ncbi:GAF domain-containing protein [Caproiciproducens sp. LBM24188]|nr:GAF domain-containing protein [Oscillospiraceae bacterium]HHV32498.1 GAF domain-containing protein [Clostridiales bacterium]
MQSNHSIYPQDKTECYRLLYAQMKSMLDGETDVVANLANASALLKEALTSINWAGFYLIKNGELLLGPFQGKPACVHIAVGKGVCGTAVAQNRTQTVENVHEFPGHIACDCDSASEIVVPLRSRGEIVGVMDIDSPQVGRFDGEDTRWLEQIAGVIETACNWPAER